MANKNILEDKVMTKHDAKIEESVKENKITNPTTQIYQELLN